MAEECMNFFDDAEQFIRNKKDRLSDESKYDKEKIIKELRKEFENATLREIEKALSRLEERDKIPDNIDEIIKKVRIWLED
jgi:glutamyl-tRNA reductase